MVSEGAEEVTLVGMTSPGPHLLRIEKTGDAITVSLCVDYKGEFTADYTRTIGDVRAAAPFLNNKNTYLFFGRPGVIYHEMRLVKSPLSKE